LVSKTPLLVFLNTRGRHRPHIFIAADRTSAEFGVITGNVEKVSLDNYEIAFVSEAGSVYGKLLEHNPECPIIGPLKMNPGDGLLGLEIQERLYRFLVTCAASLLSDVSPNDYFRDDLPEQPEPPSIAVETDLNQSVVATRQTPYRLPASFDIRRLLALINAKRAATEDHILALREDPRYFSNILQERREHRAELLKYVGGREPSFTRSEENRLWNLVIGSVVCDAFAALGMWDEIKRQLDDLMQLMDHHSEGLTPEKALPDGLEQAFCKMIWSLERMCRFPLACFQMGLQSSPPMRPFFRKITGDKTVNVVVINSFENDKRRKQFLRIIKMLYDQPTRSLVGLPTLMDALEILIQKEESIKELLSPHVMGTVSDLSVLTECLREISAFQPWAATFKSTMADHAERLGRDWNTTAKQWILFEGKPAKIDFATLGAPTGNRFFYPADKTRSLESTAAMQLAEANLDEFWRMVDVEIRDKNENLCDVIDRQVSDMGRLLYRTPDWVEPARSHRQHIVPEVDKGRWYSQSDIDFELERRTEGTVGSLPEHRGTKVKTRGSPQAPPSREPNPQIEDPSSRPTLTVSWRALEVFNCLFYSYGKGSRPGEVDWGDFRQAMAEAGFFVQEKLHGSIWQFTQKENGRSIQLHGPHPRPKLDFYKAREFGRRLHRNFGWNADTFHHRSE
jgi:hypothetical protein